MIGIVEYGAGNVNAICRVYKNNLIAHKIIRAPSDFVECSKIILPGVGAFDYVIQKLFASNLLEPLNHAVNVEKKHILGICVGMQIMGSSSEEGKLSGLGWIPGEVKLFDKSKLNSKPFLPHMGWNTLCFNKKNKLFDGIDEEYGFYFVHSYYFQAENHQHVLTTTNYGVNFHSTIQKNNIMATQFHPEKSHSNGEKLLLNFANLTDAKI